MRCLRELEPRVEQERPNSETTLQSGSGEWGAEISAVGTHCPARGQDLHPGRYPLVRAKRRSRQGY